MKKAKILLLSIIVLLGCSGCFKRDNMDDITIYTTTYPIEYLVDNIYGYNSTIKSIYPNGTDVSTYKLTKKQITEYSKCDMFIYNDIEKETAASFVNNNNKIKLIDVSKKIPIENDEEELWLCPANYLMMAQQIKDGLLEYANSTILQQEIETNYDELKLTISKFEAELKIVADNSQNKTIVAGNDVFEFLSKYGFDVLSVEDNDKFKSANYEKAKNAISNKTVSYIFVLDTDEETENVKKLESLGASVVKVNSMINLSDEEVNQKLDYKEMMRTFIDQIKTEVYN